MGWDSSFCGCGERVGGRGITTLQWWHGMAWHSIKQAFWSGLDGWLGTRFTPFVCWLEQALHCSGYMTLEGGLFGGVYSAGRFRWHRASRLVTGIGSGIYPRQ